MASQLDNQNSQPLLLLTVQEYENKINENPWELTTYWYLGLALLLEGREEEAQITWMTPFLDCGEQESEQLMKQLTEILLHYAQEKELQSEYQIAWVIRQHIREFLPKDINNVLKIIELDTELNIEDVETHVKQLISILYQIIENPVFEENLLLQVIDKLLNHNRINPPLFLKQLVEAFIPYLSNSPTIIPLLINKATTYYDYLDQHKSIYFARIATQLAPNNPDCLIRLIAPLQVLGEDYNQESIIWVKQYLAIVQKPIDKVIGIHYLLKGLLTSCGDWQESVAAYEKYKLLLSNLISSQIKDEALLPILSIGGFCFYMEDKPEKNRLIRNGIARLCQAIIGKNFEQNVKIYQQRFLSFRPPLHERPLRIGYLSGCFRSHSVGFLAWWLLKYHNRERFDIHLYSLSNLPLDIQQQAYAREFGDRFHQERLSMVEMADKINADEIDILVDLDSLTSYANCVILAMKPAPIQVTWLGYDATGFPTVDYFIADHYVLPQSAQDYYTEKIWRLPQNYIGMDGFEVGIPTISRESLDIPDDGIIYFSSQAGFKRNPHNVRLQLQIIKQVPNSYFILKSYGAKNEYLEDFITPIAQEEGVDVKQLRFLPTFTTEIEHRANLAIADIVLDTYPYNGATTTLETLWMGIPLVTRVGEQFAARNSYTMMMNAGITEGIAWSDEEYVDWGVKLGQDENLRKEIMWKLRKSRQTSPLWNGKKFAREMEKAYQQMWQIYIESKK